jgi:hypothetical protein
VVRDLKVKTQENEKMISISLREEITALDQRKTRILADILRMQGEAPFTKREAAPMGTVEQVK